MAAALQAIFDDVMREQPAITSVDELMEFARRTADGRNFRPKRNDAVQFMQGIGRYQVYKRVPVEWPGTISKHPL